jgi:leader peptidase (prepilin peptidase)/N-methyltransferase
MTFSILLKFIVVLVLIYIAFIDYKHRIIPDKCSIAIACLGIVNTAYDFGNVMSYIISAALVFAFFLILAMVTNGGMGGGDIKLLTALALIFGRDILLVILFTYTAATIMLIPGLFNKKLKFSSSVALGPYITFGVFVQVINLIFI